MRAKTTVTEAAEAIGGAMAFVGRLADPLRIRMLAARVMRRFTASGVARSGSLATNDEPAQAPTWTRTTTVFLASQVAFGVLIAVTTGLQLTHLHGQALREAKHELRSLSLVLADQAERAFEAVDLMLTGIAEQQQSAEIRTPDDFRRSMSGFAVHDELRTRAGTLPQLDAITVIDSDGNLVNFSRFWPVPKVSVADRDYFKALKRDPGLRTSIGEPVQNRGTGTWTMYLARKVSARDGTFVGLVLGAIQVSYFEDLYRDVAAGPDSAISMFRRDGVLMARYPHSDGQLGHSFGQTLAYTHQEAGNTGSLVVRKTSEVDGQDKLIAVKPLLHYPVVVNVMNSVPAVLSAWRRQAIYLIGAAVLLVAVAGGIGMLMLRHLRSQQLLSRAGAATAKAEAELLMLHERERTDLQMRIQHVRFGAALSNMSQALCMFDSAGSLIVANSRVEEMFGLPARSIAPGTTLKALSGATASASNLQRRDVASMRRSVQRCRSDGVRCTLVHELADGRALSMIFVPLEDGGFMMTMEDITERRLVEVKITHMAHHDLLTGLPNRVLFQVGLRDALCRSRMGERGALLYLDLDDFAEVNDTLGHPAGDVLLQAVTQRILALVHETDMVARLGGDEFAIVQSGFDQPADAAALAQRLIHALSVPFEIDGNEVIIGTCIGIAVVGGDAETPEELLKQADTALYSAKAEGRSRYRLFEPVMNAAVQARRTMGMDLRRALAAGEFEVFYQPLMTIRTRSVNGFEALLRWNHPIRGKVPPSEFIPVAEQIGLIKPLGVWVLNQACRDAMTWPGRPKVAVNVSVVQFASGTLVADVASALQESGLEAGRLELEITESVMLGDAEAALAILNRLRDLGVGIALDDFGTGYSSLSYLRLFPFTKVKIDRCFIEGLGKAADSDAIVTAIAELCATLGMISLAEGVETEDQLEQLRATKCREAQGFLFSRPCPAAEVTALCRRLGQPALMAI
jgi:diguanylate cyclase (GGDEF)-like protein